MKKNKIRLSLNRETLRHLGTDEASNVQGGSVISNGCPLITVTCFNCITQHSCPTRCGQDYCYAV
ncbi:MAG TPA: class I lanthipeptide [Thermoanaerobaculia bacterium]|jgi:hypothetical protein